MTYHAIALLAALPVVLTDSEFKWPGWRPGALYRQEFALGQHFISHTRETFTEHLLRARAMLIPVSLFGGWLVARLSFACYGRTAAIASCICWGFCPAILAHGALVTPDVAAAVSGVAVLAVMRAWLRDVNACATILLGLIAGIAVSTKGTWVVFAAILPIIWISDRVCFCRHSIPTSGQRLPAGMRSRSWRDTIRESSMLLIAALIAVLVLNCAYGFSQTLRPLGEFQFRSRVLSGVDAGADPAHGNRFDGTLLQNVRVPIPADFLIGLDQQKSEFERGKPSYLGGQWQHGGWWYYYLYAMAVKLPMCTVVLICLIPLSCLIHRPGRDEVLLLIPAVTVLVVASSQTGINKHFRYIIPALPLLYVLVSRPLFRLRRWSAALTLTAVSLAGAESLFVFPHSMSFFNFLSGGPLNGASHLLNSNISWGQEVPHLIKWNEQYPERQPLYAAMHTLYDPGLLGLRYSVPIAGTAQFSSINDELNPRPPALPAGWYAVDVNFLFGYPYLLPDNGRFVRARTEFWTQFQKRTPDARIGYSIYIYHITSEEAEHFRAVRRAAQHEAVSNGFF